MYHKHKGCSSVGRAPRLHARQCFSEEVIKRFDLIDQWMSYSMLLGNKRREQ